MILLVMSINILRFLIRILPAGQTADSYFSEKSSFRFLLRMGDTLHQSRIKSNNYLIMLFYFIN